MDYADHNKMSEIRFHIQHSGIYLLKFYGLYNTHNNKILETFVEEFHYEAFFSHKSSHLNVDYILDLVRCKTENEITVKALDLIKRNANDELLLKEIKSLVNELAIKNDFE